MNADEAKADFKRQFNEAIDNYAKSVPNRNAPDVIECAMAAGMLLLLSAMKMKDGPKLGIQVHIMHAALIEVGEERGWTVDRNKR